MKVLRSATLGSVSLAAAVLLTGWATELVHRQPSRVEDVVALGAVTSGVLVALWYGLTAVALLLADFMALSRRTRLAAARLRDTVARLGAPVLRRAAVLGVGAGLALTGIPAAAVSDTPLDGASAQSAVDDTVPPDLRPGLSPLEQDIPGELPTRPDPADDGRSPPTVPGPGVGTGEPEEAGVPTTGEPDHPPASERATPQEVPRPTAAPGAAPVEVGAVGSRTEGTATVSADGHHVVRPGDSLWEIAAAHLGDRATPAEIAAEWPRWYQTNRAVIGADPDLIHPGQALLAPTEGQP